MNSLIIFADEGWEGGVITLRGQRAQQVFYSHEFVVGQEISVARFGGARGKARVEQYSSDHVELSLFDVRPSLELRPVDLIVGLSRPQTTKKVIQAAVMSGVRSLHFVHTASGEKSYLDSHLLRPECLQVEVVKALEQTGEGVYPPIYVHRTFFGFRDKVLDSLGSTQAHLRLVAAPGDQLMSASVFSQRSEALILAVGSEAGWVDREILTLKERGFVGVGLGPRVLRVEVALSFLLGQSLLLPLGKAGEIPPCYKGGS
jgi:16S rRNA (uracil1498-N3)-methyltransferase